MCKRTPEVGKRAGDGGGGGDGDGGGARLPPQSGKADAAVVPPHSPPHRIDPVVGAANTIMFGLVVHFGTMWSMMCDDEDCHHDYRHHATTAMTDDYDGGGVGVGGGGVGGGGGGGSTTNHPPPTPSSLLFTVLLLHEYWVYLQHANVLANPLLQRLDRRYGIALLKSNRHWSIAGTLSSYWAREALGMFVCLPFLSQAQQQEGGGGGRRSSSSHYHHHLPLSATQYLVMYSIIYHAIKSRGVRADALDRSSSRYGIMTLVVDDFYLHDLREASVTVLRLALQGFDTYVHYRIVRDMSSTSSSPSSSSSSMSMMDALFAIWVAHAALNQLFRCSTASAVVGMWHALSSSESGGIPPSPDDVDVDDSVVDDDADDGDFVVRRLLRRERVSDDLRGRRGAASDCVDKAVRLETAIAILAVFFMVGLGEVPLGAFSGTSMTPTATRCLESLPGYLARGGGGGGGRRTTSAAAYTWLLWGLLHGVWATFLRHRRRRSSTTGGTTMRTSGADSVTTADRLGSLLRLLDLGVAIEIGARELPPDRRRMMLLACVLLTGKAFARSMRYPRMIRTILSAAEFATKLAILRMLADASPDDATAISSVLAIAWVIWVVFSPAPTPCEGDTSYCLRSDARKNDVAADAVFLGHPALLSDAWALWLLPYPLSERWSAPWWTRPLWPVHYLVGWYVCNYRRRLFGDGAAFFCCDDNRYGQTRMQNWVASHFGRHFVTNSRGVKANIEACARHAEKVGVKVLCLGALNKSESINGGGLGVVKALGPNRRLSVIHGNHLTAAAVVQTISQCFGERKVKLFLTGASSKVGWAVAQALRDRHGYDVLCHSTDPGRRKYFEQNGFAAASTLAEGSAHSTYWIVGKYDPQICNWIPQNAVAIVFSVPHPLESRRDLRVIEAGTLHMDLSRLDRPRVFTNKLKVHEIFACHAAGAVAVSRLEERTILRIDEVGPVDPNVMDSWLDDARRIGFVVPKCNPVLELDPGRRASDKPPVVIVGGGPSGLSVAAYLSQKRIPHILLESENDPNLFGSWAQHFKGLEITTQKKWCNLPGLSMSDKEFPNENVTAADYQRYLKQYVHRYAINIRRGATVISVEKGSEKNPYLVKYLSMAGTAEVVRAWSVVVATGKHRIPRNNTSDDIVSKLDAVGIPHIHSTEMSDDATWSRAIRAAQDGRLCLIGFGNSSSDLATMILNRCDEDGGSDSGMKATIHVAARTIPPVFPRRYKLLRVDTLGYLMRVLPAIIQEILVKLLWAGIPGSKICQSAFPSHLQRWKKIEGRVPVIDKHGMLAKGFQSGRLVGHGPVLNVTKGKVVHFSDGPTVRNAGTVIDMVILATGYREECVVEREDRLNGVYKCGFGKSDRFLPILSISEDARGIADDISASY